jgi:hypothetical protein
MIPKIKVIKNNNSQAQSVTNLKPSIAKDIPPNGNPVDDIIDNINWR